MEKYSRAFRRWSAFTAADVQHICDHTPPEAYSRNPLSSGEYMPAYFSGLNGRSLCIEAGARRWEYSFHDTHMLSCTGDGESYENIYCMIHEAPDEPGMYFVHHYCPGAKPPTAHTMVIDLNTGRATLVIARIGHPECPYQVQREFLFGTVAGMNVSGDEHCFTDDLVGKAIRWTYQENGPKVKHIYASPLYYTYTGFFDGGFWMASNPADYVRINDHMYIFSMVEERQSGIQGLFLINTETVHDIASFFGCYAKGMECATAGAVGVWSESYTTRDEYGQMI